MNVFAIARECFNIPEQYSIVTTRAQVYVSLYTREMIDYEEYCNLIDNLQSDNKDRFVDENKFAVNAYFTKLKKVL